MLAQVVTGTVMHMWDVLSDIYVTLLWWQAGRVNFVIAASCLLFASTLFTGKLAHQYLGRSNECESIRPRSRQMLRLSVILLTPFNAHNIVFGYMVAHYGTPDRSLMSQDAYLSQPGTWAYYNFLWLKGLHTGIESIPLALLTGIDLLTGGGSVGALVKWTSLGLSFFSICFSCSLFALGNEHYSAQESQNRAWERFLDLFCLMGLDVVWFIIAFGWTLAYVPGIYCSSLTIGLGFLLIWCSMLYFWLGFFSPAGKAWPDDATAYEFVKSCVLPYKEALGLRETIITEVAEGSSSAAWVIPMMSLVSACCGGAVPCVIDLMFALPQPGCHIVATYATRAAHVAVVKRAVLLTMCAIYLACSFSVERLAFTVCCVGAHTYFSLRCHKWTRPEVSVFRLIECIIAFTSHWLGFAVTHGVAACAIFHSTVLPSSKLHETVNDEPIIAELLRPKDVVLSDEEVAFFEVCESIISAEQTRAVEQIRKQKRLNCIENLFAGESVSNSPSTPRSPKRSSIRDELAIAVRECATWVALECSARTSHNLHDLTTLLKLNYMPSMLDTAALGQCISALKALRGGQALPSNKLVAPAESAASATVVSIDPSGCWPSVRIFKRLSLRKVASTEDEYASRSFHEPIFKAVEFSTIADPLIWDREFDTSMAYSLSKQTESADFFLSHCWLDDAFIKSRIIRSHLFMQPFCAFVVAASLLLALAFIPGGFMLTDMDHRVQWWLPSVCCMGAGMVVLAWGLTCHNVAVSRGPWRFFKPLFWFDKCCIDQTSEASKNAGIEHLGDSLHRCKRMLIIFSSTYLQRLWCVYELATFSRLIKENAELVAQGVLEPSEVKTLKILSLTWGNWWDPRNLVNEITLSEEEKTLLANFSCTNAKFWRRADQEIVLGKIRESWGSEAAFDAYVHDELPIILQQGKVEFFTHARQVTWQTIVTLFSM